MCKSELSTDEGSAFLVAEGDPTTRAKNEPVSAFDDPDKGENGKDEGRPVDESRRGLVCEDGPEGPCDGDGSR